MLCFTSATQGWLITKLRAFEIIGLLLVTFALFRPDAVVGIFSPEYIKNDINQSMSVEPGKVKEVRLHITRNTQYGDRFKLYKFDIKSSKSIELFSYLGIKLSKNNGKYLVSDLKFSGKAQKIGIEPDDQLTLVEFNNSTHLSKNWGYVIGLILLSIILIIQLRNSRFNGKLRQRSV